MNDIRSMSSTQYLAPIPRTETVKPRDIVQSPAAAFVEKARADGPHSIYSRMGGKLIDTSGEPQHRQVNTRA